MILSSKYFQENNYLKNIPEDWFEIDVDAEEEIDYEWKDSANQGGKEILRLEMLKLPNKNHTLTKQSEIRYK